MQNYQTTGSVRAILKVAGPIAISLAIPQIQQFVNTSFLGHYDTLDQSVLGIGGIVFLFLLSFSFGISSGAMIFFSRYSGMDDNQGLGRSFNTLITTAILLSLLVSILNILFTDQVLDQVLQDKRIITRVQEYVGLLMYSLPIFMVIQVINSLLVSIGKSILILRITLLGTVTHILFDYLLIYGHLGFEPHGIIGSAYAAIIADVVMLTTGMLVLYRKGFVGFYGLKLFRKYDLARAYNQLKICFPLMLQYIITLGGWLAFFVFIENMGEKNLAASQAVRSAMGLCSIFIWSFGGVSNSFTSNLLGQHLINEARTTIYRIAGISFSGTLIFSLIFLLVPEAVMRLLTSDPEVVKLGIGPLRVLAGSILTMSLGSVPFNGLIGTGKVWVSISIEILAVIIYLIYLVYYLLPLPATLSQMWTSEYVYWIVLIICSFWYINSRYFGKSSRKTDF